MAIAYTNNPGLQLSTERLLKTKASVAQILAIKRPQINASASYSRLLNVASSFGGAGGASSASQLQNPFAPQLQFTPPGSQTIPLGQTTTGSTGSTTRSRQTDTGTDDGSDSGSGFQLQGGLNNYSISASITQLIDLSGLLKAAEKIGDLETQIQTLDVQRTQRELTESVKLNYYGVLRARELVKVSEASVEQNKEQLRVTEAQKKAGVAAEFDVLRARTQLQTSEQSRISAVNQLTNSRTAFANALGINPATPVDLTAPEADPTLPALDEKALIESAIKNRPESRQAALSKDKAHANIKLAHRGLDPSAAVTLSTNYNPKPTGFVLAKSTGALNVTVSLPLSNGGSTRAQIDSAKSDARSAAIQQDQFLRGIQTEVQQVIVAVKDADERLKAARANVTEAREAYRLAGVRFQAGVDTQLSVNDAQTVLTQAESNVVNARYDYLIALARLERIVAAPLSEEKK
ncbi:MAG: TolC family protein [Armatimonas sp.]